MNKQLAFVFPGQGSQSVGMLADLNNAFPIVKKTFDEASEVFGRDMWLLAQQGPEQELAQTEITQPIMLIAGVAAWRAWCEASDIRPALMAGHSLGEYTAYVCAESITLADGVALVKRRGAWKDAEMAGGHGRDLAAESIHRRDPLRHLPQPPRIRGGFGCSTTQRQAEDGRYLPGVP